MKPHEPVKRAGSISRARSFIRSDLGWLTGFPDTAGRWVSVPEGQKEFYAELERESIRKSTYRLNKLRGDFPRVLPKIVGDVDLWFQRHQALMNVLKPVVNGSGNMPISAIDIQPDYSQSTRNKALQIKRDKPELEPVVNAFSWLCWLNPNQFASALKWIRLHEDNLLKILNTLEEDFAVLLLLRSYEIKDNHGSARSACLIEFLATENLFMVSTVGGNNYLTQLRAITLTSEKNYPDIDSINSEWQVEFSDWLQWLVLQNDRVARVALNYFALIRHSLQINEWIDWWLLVRLEVRVFEKSGQTKRDRKVLFKSIENPPLEFKAEIFFNVLKQFSLTPDADLHRVAGSVLKILPIHSNSQPIRLQMLLHWNSHYIDSSRKQIKILITLLNEYRDYLTSHASVEEAISPLRALKSVPIGISQYQYYSHVDTTLLSEMATPKQIQNFYRCLSELHYDKNTELHSDDSYPLIVLAGLTATSKECVSAFTQFKDAQLESYLACSLCEIVLEFCCDEISHFGALIRLVHGYYENRSDSYDVKPQMFQFWHDVLNSDIRIAVLDGHLPILHSTACKYAVVTHHGGKAINFSPDHLNSSVGVDWIIEYPEQLHAVLKALSGIEPDAETVASRILQKDFPKPRKIRQEIKALQERQHSGNTHHVEARIKKLKLWLKCPPKLSDIRLQNLEKKLRQAFVRVIVLRCKDIVDREYSLYLQEILQCDSLPHWAHGEQFSSLIMPLRDLKPTMKKLAIEVMLNRMGEPPWDMRSRAANKRFLNRMFELDINMTPWLDNAPVVTVEHGERNIVLTLERDPLEVLSMGEHFQTCLSPGDINYFSVFANAADINKQVLYGRDSKSNRVIARCLLAITNAGGIVKFHAYCHDGELDFVGIVSEYVTNLAKDMKTIALRNGSISKLIASHWYDDGVVDITNQFASLSDEEFIHRLELCDLSEVTDILTTALSPLNIDELTLPHILQIDVFNTRPELVLPLFGYVVQNYSVRSEVLIRVAKLLILCDRVDEVRQLMPRLIKRALEVRRYYLRDEIVDILNILLPVSASKVLWLLSKSRRRGVRNWSQESDPDRLYLGGVANLKLNRRKTAETFLKRAIAESTHASSKSIYAKVLDEIADQ